VSPEERRFRGQDAKQLLDNKLFKEAFAAVDEYLNQAALSCSPDDATKAQRIVISKQLLQAVKREVVRQVEDGVVADVQINELEQRRGLRKFIR
jgi:hypothetical protein